MSEVKKLFEQIREEAAVGARDAVARGEEPPKDVAKEAAVYGVKAEELAPSGWRSLGEVAAEVVNDTAARMNEQEQEIER